MSKAIEKWLKKLTKANEESFGTGRLDCCELNERANGIKKSKKIKTDENLKNKKD